MDLLSGINLYSLQNAQMRKSLKKSLTADAQVTEQTEVKAQQKTKLSAREIFDYMANQSVSVKIDVTKKIQVNAVADAQQYERIGNFMKDFEQNVENSLQMLNNDFGQTNLSDSAKMKIVLRAVDKTMM